MMWTMSKKYADFFLRTKDERFSILQGSRRSGKTTNTFLFMYVLSRITRNQKYSILTYQSPQLNNTIQDFENATGYSIRQSMKYGKVYVDDRGNKFSFEHCDDRSKALGNQCDLLFMNESTNIPEDIADAYMLGCTQKVILNFNPIHHGWQEKYINENNLLITTWKDNDYLTDAHKSYFLDLKKRYESPTATPLDKFNYEVFYLGQYSNISGSIFTNVSTITLAEYINIPSDEFYGLDFGFRNGGDATSLVGVKIYNNTIYAHLYIYDNMLEVLDDLAEALFEAGVKDKDIFADYGGMGKSRIEDLIYNYDFCMQTAAKPKIMDNISRILSFKGGLRITENSKSMLNEVASYEIKDGKLSEKNNHSIDALRYAFNAAVSYLP